jgi:hypothetical protein
MTRPDSAAGSENRSTSSVAAAKSGSFRRLRWVWLLIVIFDIFKAPQAISGLLEQCRRSYWYIGPTALFLVVAAFLNWWWFMLWWKTRPSKQP